MSLGPGKLQTTILENLQIKPISLNILLWKLAKKERKIDLNNSHSGIIEFGNINKAFHNNFLRAINSLKDNKRILVNAEKISTLEDLIKYYPYKTLSLEIKNLRMKLLPEIVNFIQNQRTFPFTNIEVEENSLTRLKTSDIDAYKTLISNWLEIEDELKLVILSSRSFSYELIDIFNKGRALFHPFSKISVNDTLGNLIKSIENSSSVNKNIFTKLYQFYERYFINGKLEVNVFKNLMYSAVSVGKSHGSSNVTPALKKYLYEKERDLISSLPDHVTPPARNESRWFQMGDDTEIKFSPLLDKIIDRHLFKDFKFLEAL